jgi:hypothetical protein
MSQSSEEMRPARLWRQMPVDERVSAAGAFWRDEQAALEQAEAVALIARQIKFRPKSVLGLPVEKKARHLASLAQVSDLLAARLLVAYHIEHEDGLIKDETPKAPDADTLDKAVTTLAAAYPKADVTRYFWTLLWQDPETWGGLQGRPELVT